MLWLVTFCFIVNSVALAEDQHESTNGGAAAVDTAAEPADASKPVASSAAATGGSTTATRQPAANFPFSAANKQSSRAAGDGLVMSDPVTVIGGLLLVLLMIVVIGWLMRRMNGIASFGGQAMKIVAALSVGNREKVLLIEVGDQQILVGVAPGRVSCLQTFESPVIDSKTSSSSDFSTTIKQMIMERVGASDSSNTPTNTPKRTTRP